MDQQPAPKKMAKVMLAASAILFLVVGAFPIRGNAQELLLDCQAPEFIQQIEGRVQLNVPLPGVTDTYRCKSGNDVIKTYTVLNAAPGNELSTYLRSFYVYFVWIVGILATVMVMYAGIQWITAAGNSSKIENAKSTMNGAFIGLVLALSSYVILNTINPELVTLRVPFVDQVKPEFGGGFCTTINGIDYQVLADNDGKKCGEVFQFTDANDSKKNKICMSASCPTPQSCIECERKDFPFDSCEGTGLECGFYDSRVIVEGRVVDAGTHPVKWVKFFRKNIKAGDSDTAFVWKEVDKIDDESKFVTGGTFTFDTLKPVPLNGFNFHVSFDDGSIPGDRECGWIDPSGQEDFYVFDLEYGVGQAAQKSFNFDFSEIYTTCTS